MRKLVVILLLLFGWTAVGQDCSDDFGLTVVPTGTEGEYSIQLNYDHGSYRGTSLVLTFGDGEGLFEANLSVPYTVTHTYEACNDYTIAATFNTKCPDGTEITVSLTYDLSTGGGGGEITSALTSCGTYNFTSSDADISPSSVWSFGDGSFTTDDYTTSHTYTANGVYVITVNDPTDPLFCSEYEEITVTGLPESEVTATTNCVDNNAVLMASGEGGWTYAWNLGDGNTATGQSLTHTYAAAGTYLITLTVTDGAGCSSVQTLTVTVGPLDLDYSVSDRCLGEPFTPDWVPSGADSYSWDMGDGSTYTDQYPVHTYTLDAGESSEAFVTVLTIVKDGCTSSHSELVTVSRMPEISVTSTMVPCDPMAYNFTATANYYTDLTWEIEGSDFPATAGEPYYYLFGSGGLKNNYLKAVNGACETSVLEQVTVTDGLSVGISGELTFCAGGSTILEAVVTGGSGDYTYNWLKEGLSQGTEPTLVVDEAGEYTLTVSEAGCESFTSATVMVEGLTLPVLATTTTTSVDCPGAANGTYTLTFAEVPAGGYTVDGGDVQTELTYTGTGLTEGTHYLTIAHPLNPECNFVAEVTIGYDGPVLDITATPVSCVDGGTFTIAVSGTGASVTEVNWYLLGDETPVYTTTGLTYTNAPGGFYYAQVELSDGCIVTSETVQMTLPHLSAVITDSYVCEEGGSATATVTPSIDPGSGTFSYLWSTGATSASTTLTAGSYEVTITETGSGCTLVETVTVEAISPLTLTPSSGLIGCADGGEIAIKGWAAVAVSGGSGAYTYTWLEGATDLEHYAPTLDELTSPATYTVTVTDVEYGCSEEVTIAVSNSPTPSVSVTVLECGAEALASDGVAPYTYYWKKSPEGDLVGTSGSGIAPSLVPGTYTVEVKDAYGCTVESGPFTVGEAVTPTVDLAFKFTFGPKPLPEEEDPIDENLAEEMQIAADQILEQLSDCIAHQTTTVRTEFSSTCLNRDKFSDKMKLTYPVNQQQYTLYYYDRAGNLTKTVPPEGVEFLTLTETNAIINYRNYRGPGSTIITPEGEEVVVTPPPTPSVWIPGHRLETTYEYNSLHELISQTTPDGGTANYIYDSNKRLRFSQSARQQALGLFSYTKYDALGRPVEAGESNLLGSLDFANQLAAANFTAADDETYPATGNQEVMRTVYSTPSSITYYGEPQTYTQNRVSYVIKDEDGDFASANDQYKTHYSYDVHGNVNWMAQEDPVIGKNFVAYEYDLISGNVKEVKYNEKRADKFFHRYTYDANNRLASVKTSRDHVIWDEDANYEYYLHGPLKRKEIGEDDIQGEDYTYTIHGWLKAINNTGAKADDPGQDGMAASPFMTDVFGMTLGYFKGDFTRGDGAGTNIFANKNLYASAGDALATQDLYNGNISSWGSRTNTGNLTPEGETELVASRTHLNVYQYDDLQRIRSGKYLTDTDDGDDISFTELVTNQYASNYTYDRNGNLHTLKRYGKDGSLIDDLTYAYTKHGGTTEVKQSNQLATVTDLVATELGTSLVGTHTYDYDESGNLTKDTGKEMLGDPLAQHDVILDIEWNVAGKVEKITKTVSGPQIDQTEHVLFHYDAVGNRIGKEHMADVDGEPELTNITRYALDATGNVMAIYKIEVNSATVDDITTYTAKLELAEQPIYGSTRIGMNTEPVVLQTWEFTEGMAPDYTYDEDGIHTISELSNWILAGIKTAELDEDGSISELCHCQIKQTAFTYDEGTETYTYAGDADPLPQTYYGKISNGLAVGETTEGELDFYAVAVEDYLGTTNQCILFNTDNEPVKGTESINQIDPETKPLISQVTGNENYYRMFVLDEDKHPKAYLINKTAQGWGEPGSPKGEVDADGTLINEGYEYGHHMAIIEDHINARSVLYTTRYIPEESDEDCLGKVQVVAYEYGADLAAEPTETVLTEIASGDTKGQGEIQLSQDGTHLVYYNRTDNISGFAHKTVEVNLFELGGDKTTIIGSKIVARTMESDEITPDYVHYGTYGKASVDFAGGNLLFSQRGIFEENEADEVAQDGSEKQVYVYNATTGSISYTTVSGTAQYNEVRRGKNLLYYVPNEQESAALNEFALTADAPYPVTELPTFPTEDGFVLVSSLPSQPFKLVGDEEPELNDRLVGAKNYEFNDHLSNVRAVTSDRRGYVAITATAGEYTVDNAPELIAWTDYYPFGMRQRGEQTSEYRYAFNGMEQDDEVKGGGHSLDFGARMYDPRIGRWFSLDDELKPYMTPYQFGKNNGIIFIDPDGNDEVIFNIYWEGTGDNAKRVVKAYIIEDGKDDIIFRVTADGPIDDIDRFSDAISGTQEYIIEPFVKGTRAGNTRSWHAKTNRLPLAIGNLGVAVDDYTYLGILLEYTPEVLENYESTPWAEALNGAVGMTESMQVAEYAGYAEALAGVVMGLRKLIIKKLSKELAEGVTKGVDEAIEEGAETAIKKAYSSPTVDELSDIAVDQYVKNAPLDRVGNASIYGSKGLTDAGTFIYDLALVEGKGSSLFKILSEITEQAKAAGAQTVQINGYSVINDDLIKFFTTASENGGSALGWTVSGGTTKGANVILTKSL